MPERGRVPAQDAGREGWAEGEAGDQNECWTVGGGAGERAGRGR